MKVHVIYSSLSGCTKRLAQRIYEDLETPDKAIFDLAQGKPDTEADVLLLGYWVDKGGPNAEMKKLMETISGKYVGVFCTLAYFCDSQHGIDSVMAGAEALKENNTIIGTYVCNGALAPKLIEQFRQRAAGPHSANPASEIRWEIFKDHPTQKECALGAERFQERIQMLKKMDEAGVKFESIIK
jgi:flavodoxin